MKKIALIFLILVFTRTEISGAVSLLEFLDDSPDSVLMKPIVERMRQRGYEIVSIEKQSKSPLILQSQIKRWPTYVMLNAERKEISRIEGTVAYPDLASLYEAAIKTTAVPGFIAKSPATPTHALPILEITISADRYGLKIISGKKNSILFSAGLKKGDLFLAVNNDWVSISHPNSVRSFLTAHQFEFLFAEGPIPEN
jgi:hypothetical protein